MAEFKLPDVGEGLTEAEIVTWKVKEGDTIAINDIVVEIETAKSLVELPSPFAGVVQKLIGGEGETVPVGTPIIAIGDRRRRPSRTTAPRHSREPSRPYLGMAEEGRAARRGAEIDPVQPRRQRRRRSRSPSSARSGRRSRGRSCRASPSPRLSRARRRGRRSPSCRRPRPRPRRGRGGPWPSRPSASWPRISASTSTSLAGTGRNGAVTREDVEAATGTAPRRPPRPRVHRPGRGSGRRASRSRASQDDGPGHGRLGLLVPHVTEWVTLDVTRTMEFVDRLKGNRDFATSGSPAARARARP